MIARIIPDLGYGDVDCLGVVARLWVDWLVGSMLVSDNKGEAAFALCVNRLILLDFFLLYGVIAFDALILENANPVAVVVCLVSAKDDCINHFAVVQKLDRNLLRTNLVGIAFIFPNLCDCDISRLWLDFGRVIFVGDDELCFIIVLVYGLADVVFDISLGDIVADFVSVFVCRRKVDACAPDVLVITCIRISECQRFDSLVSVKDADGKFLGTGAVRVVVVNPDLRNCKGNCLGFRLGFRFRFGLRLPDKVISESECLSIFAYYLVFFVKVFILKLDNAAGILNFFIRGWSGKDLGPVGIASDTCGQSADYALVILVLTREFKDDGFGTRVVFIGIIIENYLDGVILCLADRLRDEVKAERALFLRLYGIFRGRIVFDLRGGNFEIAQLVITSVLCKVFNLVGIRIRFRVVITV